MAYNILAECARLANCGGKLSEEKFYTLAAALLCKIAENTAVAPPDNGNGEPEPEPEPIVPLPVTWIPLAEVDTSVTNLTLYQPLLADTHDKLYLNIYNTTNESLVLSFNGGLNDHIPVTPNGSVTFRIGAQGRVQPGNVFVKALSVVPNSGSVYVSAYYGGGSGIVTSATWVPLGQIETDLTLPGSVDITTYQTLLSDTNGKLYVDIYNGSNEAILVSFTGGSTNNLVVSAFGSQTLELGEAGGTEDSNISVKAVSTLPSSGIIYAAAYY